MSQSRSAARRANGNGGRPSGNGGRRAPVKKNAFNWWWLAAGAALLLVLLPLGLRMTANNSIDGLRTYSNLSRNHSEAAQTYAQTPPVGGTHSSVWQNCGVYSQPITSEHGVHSLEHGAVWVTYQPGLAEDQVAKLRDIVGSRAYGLLSPFPDLPAPIVASAWGVQVSLDDASDPRLTQFLATYLQGAQTPEPGASCSGGTSALAGA